MLIYSIKISAELLSLFRISFPSFIISIIDKPLGKKNIFSIILLLKLFVFFIGVGRVHDLEALSLFLIDTGVVKCMDIKFKHGSWSKRVHEGHYSEANIAIPFFLKSLSAGFFNNLYSLAIFCHNYTRQILRVLLLRI